MSSLRPSDVRYLKGREDRGLGFRVSVYCVIVKPQTLKKRDPLPVSPFRTNKLRRIEMPIHCKVYRIEHGERHGDRDYDRFRGAFQVEASGTTLRKNDPSPHA